MHALTVCVRPPRPLLADGFHKVVGSAHTRGAGEAVWEFAHPLVHRGQPELLLHIRRKEVASAKKKQLSKTEVDGVLQNLQQLQSQHAVVVSKFSEVERQNQVLWAEVTALRTQAQAQQWKIGRVRAGSVVWAGCRVPSLPERVAHVL